LNNLDKAHQGCSGLAEYARRYFAYLSQVMAAMDVSQIEQLGCELEEARAAGSTIFVAGNGGSASTATTIANDLGFGVLMKTKANPPFRFLALTDNTSVMTAIANDTGYANLFVGQLGIYFRPGDRLLAVSCSGNSPNIVEAAEYVKSHGGRVIGFTAFDGGKLGQLADVRVHVPTEKGEYGPAEDMHLVLNHILAHWFLGRIPAA
jgi:D-sedoheptulose 7-phosphate isomerase